MPGGRAGALGDAAGFSLYSTKNLGCFGDGGAVTTDDVALVAKLRPLGNYGSKTQCCGAIRGVETLIHYPVPQHCSGAYANAGLGSESYPGGNAISCDNFSLPFSPHHDTEETTLRPVLAFP